jgi:hypothetical protein
MKRSFAIFFSAAILLPTVAVAEPPPAGVISVGVEVVDGERITSVVVEGVDISADRRSRRRTAAQRRNDRLVRNVKKVYPIALQAEQTFAEMETALAKLPRQSQRTAYIAKMERRLEREYTPVLRKMTFSQGKIRLKLIDRQIDKTSFDILRELQGKFRASLWQGIATLFEADLKQSYDPVGTDREIEEIILLIESGQL